MFTSRLPMNHCAVFLFCILTQNMSFWSAASSVFGPKDSPASVVGGLPNPNHHDPWNRLHGGPSGFPAGPSWAKGADKREERDRGKEGERRDIPHIKDEKDRYDIQLISILALHLKE